MKNIDECNYYDLLEVSPDAPKVVIQEAYLSSQALFEEGAVVSYSFLSDRERQAMLNRLHEAYQTLTNDRKRIEYDKQTFSKIGRWYSVTAEESLTPDTAPEPEASPGSRAMIRLKDFKEKNGLVSLKKLREALGVRPEEISRVTRIRVPMILALENRDFRKLPPPVYVKGYLRSYAETLGIKPESLLQAYGPLTRNRS